MKRKLKEMIKINNELDDMVSDENEAAVTDIICYLRGSRLTMYHQEMVRYDILEMVISGQKRGESIESVIGNDYKSFCDDIIKTLPPRTKKDVVVEAMDIICHGFAILFLINILISNDTINIVKALIKGEAVNMNIAVTAQKAFSMVLILLVSYIIVSHIIKNVFDKDNTGKRKEVIKYAITGALISGIFILMVKLGSKVLFRVNILVALTLVVILYACHKLLEQI